MKHFDYYLGTVRESLYWWLTLIANLIWEWTNDYEYAPWYLSERFFTSLEPKWKYDDSIKGSVDDLDSDDIPF